MAIMEIRCEYQACCFDLKFQDKNTPRSAAVSQHDQTRQVSRIGKNASHCRSQDFESCPAANKLTRPRGHVATWPHGHVAMHVATWPHGYMATWLHGHRPYSCAWVCRPSLTACSMCSCDTDLTHSTATTTAVLLFNTRLRISVTY